MTLCIGCSLLQVDLKKGMEQLPPVDHSSMDYDDFGKDFYTEHPSIASQTPQQVGNAGHCLGTGSSSSCEITNRACIQMACL